jgi:hypothetical protein
MTHGDRFMPMLAELDRFRSLGSRFRGRGAELRGDDWVSGLLLLTAAIGLICLLSRLLAHQQRPRAFNKSTALFRALCRAHALDHPARRLLWKLARWRKLDQPGRLFLEPEHFETSDLSAELTARGEELQALRDRLFAKRFAGEEPLSKIENRNTSAV